jgi:hypothetical protein
MKTYNHTCSCCGGDIPCREINAVRFVRGGECPGHINQDGTCGAVAEYHRRKNATAGNCTGH